MIRRFLIITAAYIVPATIILLSFWSVGGTLWYDSARDLLSAWDNLSKPTLIGPTSGIPGIFYGPYWIWLLSFGLLFSKDPRIVTLVVQAIPYLVLFPVLLYQFRSTLGFIPIVMVWLIFIFTHGANYATGLWNPLLAPILFLFLIYLFMKIGDLKEGISYKLNYILLGFTSGLIINFHMSFGIGVFLGTTVFLIFDTVSSINKLKNINSYKLFNLSIFPLLFLTGLFLSFLPSLIFEFRHGFSQTQIIFNTLSKYGGVVTTTGLSKVQIIEQYFVRFGQLLNLNNYFGFIIQVFIYINLFYLFIKKRKSFDQKEIKLLKLLAVFNISIMFIYLTARNPVWDYHFIGMEIIFVLLIALVIKKSVIFRAVFVVLVFYVVYNSLFNFYKNIVYLNSQDIGLNAQKRIVNTIVNDARGHSFGFYSYNPAVYIYEYTYLFRWLYGIDIPYDPANMTKNQQVVYLIMPNIKKGISYDFIKYRTPDKLYKTEANWVMKDGAELVKRVRIK